MKGFIHIAIAIPLFFCLHNQAYAGNRDAHGLIIGSSAGAIVGQAIGRNVEATVLGATVGGILGAVIASERPHRHHRTVIVNDRYRRPHPPHYHIAPRYRPPRVVLHQPQRHVHKHYRKVH